MYTSFYNLREKPFEITPDPRFLYMSENHKEGLAHLEYAVKERRGFTVITGEVGTGKTTLVQTLLGRLDGTTRTAYLFNPRMGPNDFLYYICEDLGVKGVTRSKAVALSELHKFLLECYRRKENVVLIVDEAQNMPDETLEELRLLSNLETDKEKLVQIILIAQSEFEERLNADRLKPLRQRITVTIRLKPFSVTETGEYIHYRLIKAGKGGLAFDHAVIKPIYHFSAGVPRLINILASRAIMAAYLDGSGTVGRKHVSYAREHLEPTANRPRRKRSLVAYALPVFSLAIVGTFLAHSFFRAEKGPPGHADSIHMNRQDPAAVAPPSKNEESPRTTVSPAAAARGEPVGPSPGEEVGAGGEGGKRVVVRVDSATLRAEPSLDAEKVTWASRGVVLPVVDEYVEETGKTWYKVRTSTGALCWIVDKVVTAHPAGPGPVSTDSPPAE